MKRRAGAGLQTHHPRSIPAYGLDVIRRDRLLQVVATAHVTEVVAPAGYGKTVMLANWARETDRAVAWCTLTDADADPVYFAGDLAAAFREAAVPSFDVLETPTLDPDLSTFIAGIHDALTASRQQLALVLDDVHVIAAAQRTLQLLDDFIRGAPRELLVVLSGRQVPPLRRQRLRLEGQLVSIGQDDLAFTEPETAAVVEIALPEIDRRQVAETYRVTGGWPAAVRMWALAARPGHEPAEPRGTSPDVTEQLVAEVLDSLDDDLRAFVLDASVDDTVCGPLLDGIRGAADSTSLLTQCYHQGLFLTVGEQVDDDRVWYDWHQLFIAHVRGIATGADPTWRRVLEVRAAHWWRSVDAVVAVRHALRAGTPDLGAEIVADVWPDLVLAGRTETVTELVGSLPAGLTRESDLHVATAFVAASRNDEARARSELFLAHETAPRLPESERIRHDARSAALSLLYPATDAGTLAQVVARGRELLRRLEEGPWMPDPVTLALTRMCVGMGEARLQQDPARAIGLLVSAATMAHEHGLTAVHLVAQAETCIPLISTSALDEAAAVAHQVLSSAAAKGWGTPRGLAPAVAYQGWMSYWTGQLERSRRQLSRALSLFHPADAAFIGLATCFRGQASLHLGDLTAAAADVETIRAMQSRNGMPPYWPSITAALDAELSLARGDATDARRHATARVPGQQYRLATTSRARVLLRLGSPDEAVALLDEVGQSDRFVHVEVLMERLRAEALWVLGRRLEACSALDRALRCAAPFRLLLPFEIDGRELMPILTELRDHGTADDEMLTRVLNAVEGSGPADLPSGDHLSSRELSILRFLRTNLTLSEIAAAEQVSVNTVKTHASSIYRKLGAGGRREAVHAATELGIA